MNNAENIKNLVTGSVPAEGSYSYSSVILWKGFS